MHWHLPKENKELFQKEYVVEIGCDDGRSILGRVIDHPYPLSSPTGYPDIIGDLYSFWVVLFEVKSAS